MWLALLLAAADDTLDARGRRAALRELRQRLIPTARPRCPSLSEALIEFAFRFTRERGPFAGSYYRLHEEEWMVIQGLVFDLIRKILPISSSDLMPVSWLHIPRLSGRTDKVLSILLPTLDAEELHASSIEGRSPQFRVRTEWDYLVLFLLFEWGNDQDWSPRDMGIEGYECSTLLEMLEYARSMKDWATAVHPDLTQMNWDQARDASEAWHRRFARAGFGSPCSAALVVLRWPDGWTLQRLTEKRDFAQEGTSMGHCIGGPLRREGIRDGESEYWQDARDDRTIIFSLRDPLGRPQATVESEQGGEVLQVQGSRDQKPPPEAMAKLREAFWALEVFPGQRRIHRMQELTGLSDDPPDVSSIEVLPGVQTNPMVSVWERVHIPIALARQQRTAQFATRILSRRTS